MLYAIDVSDLPENTWHRALDVEWTWLALFKKKFKNACNMTN